MIRTQLWTIVVLAAALKIAPAQDAQPGVNFALKPGAVPANTTNSEGSVLGDFDLDGDLDAVVTQGGSFLKLQSRLWRSDAAAAGSALTFSDATTGSFPAFGASTLAVKAFDIDRDGDLDLLFANTTQTFQQSNAWFVNQGGAQGGAAGTFALDFSRYAGIGSPGSSVPSALVLASGGFADWSATCSFADVDLDGDMDVLQASLGPNASGATMHRLFLNDGAGFFPEYNPSGQASGALGLAAGSAAGFAEGTQLNGTTNVTGANHDITSVAWSAAFGDIDNDYDLDLVVLDRIGQSRVFTNRWVENGLSSGSEITGTRLFRDVTGSAWPTAQSGAVAMDLEFADFDGDDDLDLWAASYVNYADRVFLNDGTGSWTDVGGPLGDPGADENEVEMLDYDGDGDLDVFAANFEGINFLYKNTAAQGDSKATAASFLKRTGVLGTEAELSTPGTAANSWLSASAGDLDNDGDTDLLVTQDGVSTSAAIHHNALGVPDAVAPRIPRLSVLGNPAPAGSAPRVVAAQVYDNAGMEAFQEAAASVKFRVNGGPVKTSPATWSGGNVFRATIPGYWFGSIAYELEVTDRNGNKGVSNTKSFNVSPAGIVSFGLGTAGCAGFQTATVNSVAAPGNTEFAVTTTNCPPSSLNLLLMSPLANPSGSDVLFISVPSYVGLDPGIEAFDQPSDASGTATTVLAVPNHTNLVGVSVTFQTFSLWPAGPCTPSLFQLSCSNGLTVTVQP